MKLTKSFIKLLASELVTGRGNIAKFCELNPYICGYSTNILYQNLGHRIKVFRIVMLYGDKQLREENIVSASLDPRAILRIARKMPGLLRTRDWDLIIGIPYLLRYDIDITRVIAWVPALIQLAYDNFSKDELEKIRVKTHASEYQSVNEIFSEVYNENEVIVDVSGLRPSFVLGAQYTDDQIMIEGIISGEYESLDDFLKDNPSRWYKDMDAERKKFDQLYDNVMEFIS